MSLSGIIAESIYSAEYKWGSGEGDLFEMYHQFGDKKDQEIWDEKFEIFEENWNDIIDLANILNDNPEKITRDELLHYPVVKKILRKRGYSHVPPMSN
jgi:hypothetical protein